MTDENPFSNWPHMNGPDAHDRPGYFKGQLPGGDPPRVADVSPRANALERFLGGSPAAVLMKLVFVSLIVGALLMWLEIKPIDIFRGIDDFVRRIYALGFGALREVGDYIVAGAVIVVPAWIILRVLKLGGRN